MQSTYTDNLSQSEKLALCAGNVTSPPDSIGQDERRVLSVPPHGFKMPSMESVRLHDARMWEGKRYQAPMSEDGDECPAMDGEAEEQESVSYRPYHLPSMRSRGDVMSELKGMGMSWGE